MVQLVLATPSSSQPSVAHHLLTKWLRGEVLEHNVLSSAYHPLFTPTSRPDVTDHSPLLSPCRQALRQSAQITTSSHTRWVITT